MRKLIFICVCIVMYCFGFAQEVIIKDKEQNQTLAEVVVMRTSPVKIIFSDSLGIARLNGFDDATTITFLLLGYRPKVFTYTELQAQNFEVFLIPTKFSLDEIVVSASRWGQAKSDIPQKISIFSPKEVALQNPQSAADLLGATGEVFIQKSQQGGGSPMIRGFSANRLLYAIDGVRMNTAIFRAGNLHNVISLDAFAIENTEVLFGPGAIIYGSDAIGGVMSFQTLLPKFSSTDKSMVSGRASVRHSTANNEKTGHVDFSVGGKKLASTVSITLTDFDDLRMGKNHSRPEYLRNFYVIREDGVDKIIENANPFVQTPSGYQQLNLMHKLRYQITKDWELQTGFHYSDINGFSRYDRLIETNSQNIPRSAEWNYGPQKWRMYYLSLSHTRPTLLYDQFKVRLAGQYFEESRIDRNFSGGSRLRRRTQLEQVMAYSVNLDFFKFLDRHHFYYGAEFIQNDVQSEGSAINIATNSPIEVPDRYPQSTWNSYAAYVNYQFKVNNKWLLQSGMRYSMNAVKSDFTRHLSFYPFDFTSSSNKHSALTGSFGAIYTPKESWIVTSNLSTGFRAPNVDDIGKLFDFVAGEVVVPNANLVSEYAYNAEFGVIKVFSDAVKFDIGVFYTKLDNAMVRRPFQVNGADSIDFNGLRSRVYAIQNAANANVFGYHLGLEVKFPYNFTFISKYNYQRGTEEMDNGTTSASRHAAPAFGLNRLRYETKKIILQMEVLYSAQVSSARLNDEERQKPAIYAKDAFGNSFSPRWHIFNFKSLWNAKDYLSIGAGVENIFDRQYRPYSSGIVAPGRNFVFSITGKI